MDFSCLPVFIEGEGVTEEGRTRENVLGVRSG